MSKSATVRARLEPELKDHAETVFHRLGLNATQAITMFYRQVELRGGLPFDVVVPSATTKRTMDPQIPSGILSSAKMQRTFLRSLEFDVYSGLHQTIRERC